MQSKLTSPESRSDKFVGILLAVFSMFVLGYSATRVFLAQSSLDSVSVDSNVIPHQSTLWSDLGK